MSELTQAEKLAAGTELRAEGLPPEGEFIEVASTLWFRVVDERAYRRRAETLATTLQAKLRAQVEREIVAAFRDETWRGAAMDIPTFDHLAAKILAGDYPREAGET